MSIQQDIQSKFDSEHLKAYINILYTANWMESMIKDVMTKFDLTHPQFNVLKILAGARGRPKSAGEIKSVMIQKNSDMTRMIDRMILKSLVHRTVSPENRRQKQITITKEGIALLNRIKPHLDSIINEHFINKISEEEVFQLNHFLDRIRS